MSGTNLDSLNEKNFKLISRLLENVEAFPFFGTLLGLHRDGDLIPGDDDVDFYVNIDQREELLDILSKSVFDVDFSRSVNNTNHFIQATRTEGETTGKVDFYFFHKEEGVLKEKWNFHGKPISSANTLHTPIDYIYPLKKCKFGEVSFNMPSHPGLVCKHLYGDGWMDSKDESEYEIRIINNHPEVISYSKRTQILLKVAPFLDLVLAARRYYDRGGPILLVKETGRFLYDRIIQSYLKNVEV